MSTESRPRRTIRPAKKVPVEISSTNSLTPGVGSASASRSTIETTHSLKNGKRSALSDDEDGISSLDKADTLTKHNDESGKTKVKTGKNQTSKPKDSAEEKLYNIDFILTNPKSPLVNLNISDIINYGTWMSLSPESRERLCKLLPDTAFGEQVQELDDFHPSRRRSGSQPPGNHPVAESQEKERYEDGKPMDIDVPAPSGKPDGRLPEPSFFRDPHFESAARTFQDHLYTGWFTSAHQELVERHLSGIRDGSLHAPWKDEAWDRDHPEETVEPADVLGMTNDASDYIGASSDKRRGKEKASEFDVLVRKGFLKQGDIICLKHKFTTSGITVEKDALISAVHPKTSILTLTASSGTVRDLPPALLPPVPDAPAEVPSLREMTVSNAAQLVTALLDIDGRIPRAQRPRMDTRKVFTVWQWPVDADSQPASPEEAMLLERGGREPLGTLFYLRGQALDD